MFELLSIIVSAIVSFLVAKYTADRSVKEERKTRRETARLELCLSVTSLLSEVESNPERRAEDSFASEICRLNYFAKLNASGKLSSAFEKYSADYLRAFKIFKVNNMNLYNTWHSFDCWEDKDGNPVNPGHSLADEQGESGYISERQNLRAEFLNTTAHLWIAEHEICKLAIEEASTCGSD